MILAGPTGGDALTTDLNQWYSPGDTGFIIVSAALVLLMLPGLGYFYAGLARRKSALSLILVCVMAYCVTSFQWYFWGYSVSSQKTHKSDLELAFSTTADNGFIGNLDNFALMNVLGKPSPASIRIPELLYAQFQSQFAAVAIGILLGAVAERARIFPTIVFSFIWLTLVYCPMVCS
jgi:ammonium transporter, Amt family